MMFKAGDEVKTRRTTTKIDGNFLHVQARRNGKGMILGWAGHDRWNVAHGNSVAVYRRKELREI